MKRLAVILALFLSLSAWAQERAIRPLDVPMSFSGSYGELRHDHFHSGVDWRVGGKVGDPIHAIKSGYVARVSVSPWGYGNGLYINHPDGTTSVYGHMLEFRADIAGRVEKAQYEAESFTVNLTFRPDEFPVSQGDVVGRVGNTGSSAGPHLHMEVRDTETDLTLNYISLGYYHPEDRTSPQFHRVCFYGIDDAPVEESWRIHNLKAPDKVRDTLLLPPKSYVAIDATDRQEGTNAKLAVEEYRVTLDDTLLFAFKVGDMPSDRGRYIKSLIEYRESRSGGRDLVKSRVDPGNLLSDRITSRREGIIHLEDDAVHTVKLEAIDEYGNRAAVRYKVRRDTSITAPAQDTTLHSLPWLWYTQNSVSDSSMTFYLPPGALYGNINFTYKIVAGPDPSRGILSDVWQIGSNDIPLHYPGELEIAASIPEGLEDKCYMANYGRQLTNAGVQVRFGTYCVALDTIPPTFQFLGRKGEIIDGNTIRVRVRDGASGVADTRVEIDGQWYLSMYKRDVVTVELKEERLSRGRHTIVITAEDICGNTSYEKRSFTF
ncbi:MAG: peptidoglycan DD-metalloendopeptidase family protein [Bacteroidales bacterium]|nr:peptidoglycan DD-metalloendopeptidase family protein [Bacteroidales bacterium]